MDKPGLLTILTLCEVEAYEVPMERCTGERDFCFYFVSADFRFDVSFIYEKREHVDTSG